MLTWSKVLTYVKAHLSFPSTFLEDTDEQMKEYIKLTALQEFSTYIPDMERCAVIIDNTNYKHETRENVFYFFDEADADIIGIKECYFEMAERDLATGHPIMGPMSFNNMKWWSLAVFKSRFFMPYSNFNYTYKFVQPNMIEILPGPKGNFVVEYERTQPADLSRIPTALNMMFMNLALAHMKMKLGAQRSQYGTDLNTPFGNIPLNGEGLRSDGDSMRKDIIDKLEQESMPEIVIDIM